MTRTSRALLLAAALATGLTPCIAAAEVPAQAWGPHDEQGMGNTMGPETWSRCAQQLSRPGAKAYELSHLRTATMPQSPFAPQVAYQFAPTRGLPHTRHAFNGDTVSGSTDAQGTQMDGLGVFGFLEKAWDGKAPFPDESVQYYGGFRQADVKPAAGSPLLHLGIEHVSPVVTSAVLLDARRWLGGGAALKAGYGIHATDLQRMLTAEGLARRGLLAGDVVYIYTGWEDHWRDPDTDHAYGSADPGLAADAVEYMAAHKVVAVSLDNPFTDPVFGRDLPAEGAPADLPWVAHHENLTQAGIVQVQNAHLSDLARDQVWLSCTMILPLRDQGAAGSAVRPVAIGAPSVSRRPARRVQGSGR